LTKEKFPAACNTLKRIFGAKGKHPHLLSDHLIGGNAEKGLLCGTLLLTGAMRRF
jgi:hypothetical protein